ncbi:energy-coupling factor transporter ATPase [Halalkalibacter nanhaiisediminis]|uniref:Energy-coupling factor transport system ATP-binding protein n=1 Tax=Halalkalibacter nanhaiisediminis TaxID=688079 RepID=A0A562QA72_9BACI|nr:energy-coupling factor transporter ATPase [Halalkalibacter nanhaiisediminis]TWI53652.1 energy-coupling factor transport system ATP-binding protein [Halalkalibacter nanhaiisediminis]
MSALITLENVSYQYEGAEDLALNQIHLKIDANEWVTVVGRNGSGKSTFGRLLNGLLLPTSGVVRVQGLSTTDENTVWNIRSNVGMVFQNPDHQFVATTVRDDLAFGLENLGIERTKMHERIETYAALIGITPFLDMEPHRLSGGQKQRVAIAGIMAMEPAIIVFDEATSMLDPIGRKEVLETMKMLHRRGSTIISITHDMDEAVLGNRMLIFERGSLIAEGAPMEVFSKQELLTQVGLSLPFSLEMQRELEKRGISLQKLCLTEEELISELWTFHSTK